MIAGTLSQSNSSAHRRTRSRTAPQAGRDICVTGLAWTTALGTDTTEVWQRLLRGETGIREVPSGMPLRSQLAAAVDLAGVDQAASPYERHVALAAMTATAALRDAERAAEDVGLLVVGTSLGPHLDDESEVSLHAWAEWVAARIGVRRPPISVSTACSSGADAILTAATLLRAGVADVCLCGGIDLLTNGKKLGHSVLSTMSPTMIRPFDQHRDGTLLGEGAGFLVLETREAVRSRGGQIWGYVRGWGGSNDAAGPTAPDSSGAGAALAIGRALSRAKVGPGDIAVINAHGTGTLSNDAAEADCYSRLFGSGARRPVVFATKAALGHTLGATGAIEAILTLLALHYQIVPPVVQSRQVIQRLSLPLPTRQPLPFNGALGISLTLGFGGFNTCLVFERGNRTAADGEGGRTAADGEGRRTAAGGRGRRTAADRATRAVQRTGGM